MGQTNSTSIDSIWGFTIATAGVLCALCAVLAIGHAHAGIASGTPFPQSLGTNRAGLATCFLSAAIVYGRQLKVGSSDDAMLAGDSDDARVRPG